jgi:hypothetical protein
MLYLLDDVETDARISTRLCPIAFQIRVPSASV